MVVGRKRRIRVVVVVFEVVALAVAATIAETEPGQAVVVVVALALDSVISEEDGAGGSSFTKKCTIVLPLTTPVISIKFIETSSTFYKLNRILFRSADPKFSTGKSSLIYHSATSTACRKIVGGLRPFTRMCRIPSFGIE